MISLKNVNFAYNGAPVLHQIGCTIPRGEFVGVIGPNGAGKSTLLKLLVRILVPQSGEIRLNDAAINSYSRKALARLIAYVQQDFHITYNFTAWEIVLMGRYPHQKTWGFDTPEDNHIARECMKITLDMSRIRE